MKKIKQESFYSKLIFGNAGVAYANHSFHSKKIPPIYLSQHWLSQMSFPEVLDFATKHGYTE